MDDSANIFSASQRGNTEDVERFISEGADVNKKDNNGDSPIHLSALYGRTETVKLLLDRGATIDVKNNNAGNTPIHLASRYGYIETVKLLLDREAAIDVKNNDGDTPIHRAAENGKTDTVKLLLDRGADPYITNKKGKTARDLDKTGLV